jgi:uncharacterized protein (TIGR00251 family)
MTALALSEAAGALTFDVLVVPRASRERIGPVHGDRLKIQLTAPPVDGAANEALIALLARALAVPKGQIEIVRGSTGRRKTVRVRGAIRDALLAIIEEST